MLEPRESDLPVLLVVFIVLPIVAYILLGKWSEDAKKKDKINLLAQLAAEESLRAETMAAASVIPLVPLPKSGIHVCSRCYGPATTRCSRCKSVRYCSGKCQILHWRQIHKQECQQLGSSCDNLYFRPDLISESINERPLLDDNMDSQYCEYNMKHPRDETPSTDVIHSPISPLTSPSAACMVMESSGVPMRWVRSMEKGVSHRANREMSNSDDGAIFESSERAPRDSGHYSTSSSITSSKEMHKRHKSRRSSSAYSEKDSPGDVDKPVGLGNVHTPSKSKLPEDHKSRNQREVLFDSKIKFGAMNSLHSANNGTNEFVTEMVDATLDSNYSSERTPIKRSKKSKATSNPPGITVKSSKLMGNTSRDQLFSDTAEGQITNDIKIASTRVTVSAQGSNGVARIGIMKMLGMVKSSKVDRQEHLELGIDRHKKIKMLFPYEEFVEFFQYDVFHLTPRGLINCGNSCYANAVLQCLACTKPLAIYLLNGSHSRTCCTKNWCLMCDLEQHVMMLRGHGGPLSPSRILVHMRSINCQIGDGSQEDAHEFLRFLVTSMQSICLEGFGGENVVDTRLQETTFIQHTFGGRLKSKVKCLRCHHESERYENIMDLTLEILGWVESLEDALTQFTSPEDLDGENMYKCGRCASYVRAQKQLCIQVAPNILTIVLKRFQEGNYGKINKYISFPDMLDMIPFMTGTDDIPPLYILYAVVVHLDTLNASFSGHYISYIKDLQGNWFRIDDTEVQPVSISQVMSEGAYILFYMRSCPRPLRPYTKKTTRSQPLFFASPWTSKSQKSSTSGQSTPNDHVGNQEPCSSGRTAIGVVSDDHVSNKIHRNANINRMPMMEHYAESVSMEFSDATSSDWSLFTSSDEASSFTTESTRDSFSTVDYTDAVDPISSIFNNLYAPKPNYSYHKTASFGRHQKSKIQTRFVPEGKCFVLDSYLSTQPIERVCKGEASKQANTNSVGKSGMLVKYSSNPKSGPCKTSSACTV